MEKLTTLLELLAPLNKTSGEYSVRLSLYPGSESGTIHFSINWKEFIGEEEFSSYDEAIRIAQELLNRSAIS